MTDERTEADGQLEMLFCVKDIKLMPNYVDPYKHQKEYIKRRRSNDAEFRQKRNTAARERYHKRMASDPEFKKKKAEETRQRRRRPQDENISS